MWRFLLTAVLFIVLLGQLPQQLQAQSGQVQVTIPEFPITLDGVQIDQEHSAYPLITYKDITYFPLTWNAARALGLAYTWNQQSGLTIVPGYEQGLPGKDKWSQDDSVTNRLGSSYNATIASFAVTVYEQPVDQASEPYPLLQFRDITYFPMSWRYAHDLFHMNLQWENIAGLTITTDQNRLLDRIEYDDENYVYIRNHMYKNNENGYLKIAKSLQEPPQWIRGATVGGLFEHASQWMWTYKDELALERKQDELYYNNLQLTSLTKYLSESQTLFAQYPDAVNNGVTYRALTHRLSEKQTLLMLSVIVDVPVKGRFQGPKEYQLSYLIRGEAVTELPFSIIRGSWSNADGSHWVVGDNWKLLLVSSQGEISTVNDLFQGAEVEIPHFGYPRTSEGTLIIKTHSPSYSTYALDTKLNVKKLYGDYGADLPYGAYVEGYHYDLFQVDGNTITNKTRNESRTFWDYELFGASEFTGSNQTK
ncbi:hypothetical protein OB236_32665 [Paenibacillus sp. WQ 127069]|uniref:Copper amine oxidase-like N-terminal domain-containing protein n=1 Tax=Paenibacillus baimaensis TaxID=2982185 RepID=A0ABT2UQG4_9BACL|nr:hypothetical protein [Paenibacillus sp. WQ 127069]MCU6796890.1 hypothetical protein [Paenibacillus sp. WQ 127069]